MLLVLVPLLLRAGGGEEGEDFFHFVFFWVHAMDGRWIGERACLCDCKGFLSLLDDMMSDRALAGPRGSGPAYIDIMGGPNVTTIACMSRLLEVNIPLPSLPQKDLHAS